MTWLVAFVLHSTLWCGLAWLGLRVFPRAHARLRESVWYTALAASLITPTAQMLVSPDSVLWHLHVPALAAPSDGEHSGRERGHEAFASALASGGEHDGEAGSSAVSAWLGVTSWIWLAVAAGLVGVYVVRLHRFRRRLHCREHVDDARAAQSLAALSRRAGLTTVPRLTESDNLGSPVALGIGRRREICVPNRALHELDDEELSALLGHEVAHHLRRDTIRLGVLNTLQAVFFFQPLLRIALRDVHLAAEELCDEWAATQLEDRLAMASCLTEVAGWVVRQDRRIPVPCMGRRRSQLETRVHRLLDERSSLRVPSRLLRSAASSTLLILAPWFAPAITPTTEAAHAERDRGGYEHRGEHERRRPETRLQGEHGERGREHRRGERDHGDGRRSSEHATWRSKRHK